MILFLCIVFVAPRIRLSLGSYGRVEVMKRGEWGTVCDDHWTMTEGHVVCRELGYRGASSVEIDAHHGEGEGKIWMDEVECEGSELSLLDCPHETEHDCDHYEDASVVCF
ncbi:predicted protein [Nematostella vectensis]|uniref:SRCR domain-containing protein n=1 Tax=Nematostella vectensis TaxID=45351 RepID=A7S948_NEMVE|nr:predicted protein [Nematostella vectensis]|eukprot:XP_001631853.1 predicted protein [Nematostella vectensis]